MIHKTKPQRKVYQTKYSTIPIFPAKREGAILNYAIRNRCKNLHIIYIMRQKTTYLSCM